MKTVLVSCTVCKGSGWQACRHCHGTGRVSGPSQAAGGSHPADRACPACLGRGDVPCTSCGGRGVRHKDVVDVGSTLSNTRRRVGRLMPKINRPNRFDAFAAPATVRTQPNPPSATTRIDIRYRVPPTADQTELMGCAIASALFLLLLIVLLFGFSRVAVAGEAFFLFSAWAGLRAGDLFGRQQGTHLERFRQYMAICFGLCCGFLAAYLILTTAEGRTITEWVTAQTLRIAGSLFASVLGLGLLEMAWRRAAGWIARSQR